MGQTLPYILNASLLIYFLNIQIKERGGKWQGTRRDKSRTETEICRVLSLCQTKNLIHKCTTSLCYCLMMMINQLLVLKITQEEKNSFMPS